MRSNLLSTLLLSLCLGCTCGPTSVNTDGGAGGGTGGTATGGGVAGGSSSTGGGDGGGTATGGGTGGSSLLDGGVDPLDPGNAGRDTDCDGLNDAEELSTTYAQGLQTSATNPDSDGDGLKDGVEAGRTTSVSTTCGFVGDAEPATRTSPTQADSDSDGLPDGIEDANHDGRRDVNETNPADPDTDGDNLRDGAEDANHNGTADSGETNPRVRDTDADRIADGVEVNLTRTDPVRGDTDGDGCLDGNEDVNQNGVVDSGESNPRQAGDCGQSVSPDTDMDGLPNAIEDRNNNGTVDPGETNPMVADTDMDGLGDGLEDANHNGVVDPNETNPTRRDSDCDGLADGPTMGMVLGEDLNANGAVDTGETNPTRFDSDGDGISDGVERGVTTPRLADAARCANVPVDADPSTTTNPTNRDTDGDGIDDGAEDVNANGRVDPGELDPNSATSNRLPDGGVSPAGQVCTAQGLRPVVFHAGVAPDLRLGVASTFTELTTATVAGTARGLLGFDPTNQVAFVAFRQTAPGADVVADEAALQPTIAGVGALSSQTTQPFTTWDGLPALQVIANQAGTVDVKARANALANALIGAGAGSLTGAATTTGPFTLQVEFVRRQTFTVVVIALTPTARFTGPSRFVVSDVAGGSGLAQFADTTATKCETFTHSDAKVDFVFSVDDSASMAASQQALADVATAMASALQNSTLDWRVAMVTSQYQLASAADSNRSIVRGFTRSVNELRAWLTTNSTCQMGACSLVTCGAQPCNPPASCNLSGGHNGGCWIGAGQNVNNPLESVLGAARKGLDALAPATAVESVNKVRLDAGIVLITVGDADDQTNGYSTVGTPYENIQNLVRYFSNTGTTAQVDLNPFGRVITTHGIICPQGQTCNNEFQASPQRIPQVINATGGVRGAINDAPSIAATMTAIVNSTIGAAGRQLLLPPIGASVKVAIERTVGPCNLSDVPRSTVDGFDVSGRTRTVSFFGNCRPAPGAQVAVSYRHWVDTSPLVTGGAAPCQTDPFFDAMDPDFCRGTLACNTTRNVCECPSNCGTTPPGANYVCNTNPAVCAYQCTPDCGGSCSTYQVCNTAACGCECVQMATCAPGFRFQNGAGVCGCVCDTAALNCGARYQADSAQCACVCKPNCGGCTGTDTCNASTCSCMSGVN